MENDLCENDAQELQELMDKKQRAHQRLIQEQTSTNVHEPSCEDSADETDDSSLEVSRSCKRRRRLREEHRCHLSTSTSSASARIPHVVAPRDEGEARRLHTVVQPSGGEGEHGKFTGHVSGSAGDGERNRRSTRSTRQEHLRSQKDNASFCTHWILFGRCRRSECLFLHPTTLSQEERLRLIGRSWLCGRLGDGVPLEFQHRRP